jgi:hypothetical protein
MKIKKYLATLTLMSFLALAGTAVIMPGTCLAEEKLPKKDVEDALESIGNWLYTILLVVAVIFILLAAFTFITAGGDSDKVNKARVQVMYALIGVAVAVLAKGLIDFVLKIFGEE